MYDTGRYLSIKWRLNISELDEEMNINHSFDNINDVLEYMKGKNVILD